MLTYSVIFTDEAKQDLINIWLYVAEESQSIELADKFTTDIEQTCIGLSRFPERGSARNDLQENLRYLPIPNNKYLIFYEIIENEVYILSIIHSSQDYQKYFL